MHDTRLERLFEQFRRHGDVAALGEVFDATSPELLRVAMALVREPTQADDLLQQTFLTAIERAGRYEAGRRLVPWLLGILAHHAREQRRVARRAVDAERMLRPAPRTPQEALLDAEIEQALARAFSELSARDRFVLEAYLVHDKGAAEIAHELGGSPGAVRMQIHRGLERLRRVLPASLAIGAAGAALSTRGLETVRATVLSAAERAVGSLDPHSSVQRPVRARPQLQTLRVLSSKQAIGTALALALCALLATWLGLARGARVDTSSESADAGRTAAPSDPLQRGSDRDELVVAARQEVGSAASDSARDPQLGALRGRLLEHDGAPIAGKRVDLLELDERAVFKRLPIGGDVASPPLLVAQTTSDIDGVFVLSGAKTFRALHALGIDLGGSRPSVRVLDAAFAAGECVDIGDIVLAPTGVLRGRVTDPHGLPIAGARVRAGQLSEWIAQLGLYELGPDTAIGELRAVGEGEALQLRSWFEVPAWLAELEELLPLVATRTDARGEFVFPHAPATRLKLLIDRPGRATVLAATPELDDGDELDVGALTLDDGRTLAGRVLDSTGRPVVGAQVRGGRADGDGSTAVFGPLHTTDAGGRFRITGRSTLAGSIVIARRETSSPWTIRFAEGESIELRLGSEFELQVTLVDPAGAPIEAPAFELTPGSEPIPLGAFTAARATVPATSLGNGRWSLGMRPRGEYVLRVGAAGFAQKTSTCLVPCATPLELVLDPTVATEVRVVAESGGAPIAGAVVTVESSNDREGHIATGTTDPEGGVVLELPARAERRMLLRAQHSRFAPRAAPLGDPRAPMTLELGEGGAVVARADRAAFGGRRHTLILQHRGVAPLLEGGFPMFAAFGVDGVARRDRLPVGQWTWSVVESLLPGEALAHSGERETQWMIARGEFELHEGETLQLEVGAPAASRQRRGSAAGSVYGSVRVNGAPADDVDLYLTSMTAGVLSNQVQTKPDVGAFRFEAVEAGSYFLTAAIARDGLFSQLGSQRFELSPGELREFSLEYSTRELEVEVTSESGAPVAGAEVSLSTLDGGPACNARTDQDGRVVMLASREGKLRLNAFHAESGSNSTLIELAGGGPHRATLRLERGVPCSGVARFGAGLQPPSAPVPLFVRRADDTTHVAQASLKFERGEARFALVGLQPGRYSVRPHYDGEWRPEVTLVVPEGGSTTLELVLGQPGPAQPKR